MAAESTDPRSDAELVRAHRAGDARALGVLVERHLGLVYLIALSALRDREAAEDLAQEVVLRALLAFERLDEPDRFSAWFAQIARNLALDWLRRGQRHSRLVPLVPVDLARAEVPDPNARGARETMEAQQSETAVREAVWSLPPDERELVLLHFIERLTQTQIAERLGIHKSTVSRRLKGALTQMRGPLQETLRESGPALRLRREAAARTLTVLAAAMALSPAAKASLAGAAGLTAAAATAASPDLIQTVAAWLAAGGKIMATGKGLLITGVVGAGIALGTYQMSKGQQYRTSHGGQTESLAASVTTSGGASNLVSNGGFEEAVGSQPSGWRQGNPVPDVAYVYQSGSGLGGGACVGFDKSVDRYFPIAEWSQDIPHDGSERQLRLSAQVRAVDAHKAILDASFSSSQGDWSHEWAAYIGAENAGDPPANHDWQEHSGVVSVPAGTDTIHVNLQMYGPGEVYFDNVRAEFVD